MQEATYAALYVLLGLAALMYTAHQLLTHGTIRRTAAWLAHHRRARPHLRLVKGNDHETAN